MKPPAPSKLLKDGQADDEAADASKGSECVGRQVKHTLIGGEEAVDVERSSGQDDDPTSLFEEGCNDAVCSCHVDEAENKTEHQVGNAEVNRKQNVFAERRRGSMEGDFGVTHVERLRNEGRELDVVVRPRVERSQRRGIAHLTGIVPDKPEAFGE